MNNRNQDTAARMIDSLIRQAYNLGKLIGASQAKVKKYAVDKTLQEIQNEAAAISDDVSSYGDKVINNVNNLIGTVNNDKPNKLLVSDLFSSPASAVLTNEEKDMMIEVLQEDQRFTMQMVTPDGEDFTLDFDRTDEEVRKLCKEEFGFDDACTAVFLLRFKNAKEDYFKEFKDFNKKDTGETHV